MNINETSRFALASRNRLSNVWTIGIVTSLTFLFATNANSQTTSSEPPVSSETVLQEEATKPESRTETRIAQLQWSDAQKLKELNQELQLVYLTKGQPTFMEGEGTGKAMFGVNVRQADATLRSQLGLEGAFGLVVEHVTPESGAANAGVQVHDVLWKIDEQLLVNLEQFQALVEAKQTGDELKLVYLRGGKSVEASVTLTERKGIARDSSVLDLINYHNALLAGEQFNHADAVKRFNNCQACHGTIDVNEVPFFHTMFGEIESSRQSDSELKKTGDK